MSNPRDTQFEGFTNLLFDELREAWLVDWKFNDSMRQIIARRAYDLVCHALSGISEGVETLSPEEIIAACVTDLTEWPEQESSETR